MYKIKRDKKFKEQLEVENDNGEKLTLDVEITLDKQLNEFTKNWRNLEVMNINVQQGKLDYMQMGDAVISIMGVVFGENDAKKLIDFYNCNYIELIQDILPFIAGVIKPQFDKVIKEHTKRNKQALKELTK